MKYVSPKYELSVIEAKDVLTLSTDEYEVVNNEDKSGSVVMNASGLFSF